MRATINMIPHIVCPNCGNGEGFPCEHILTGDWRGSFGPWFCRECGHSITGKRADDGTIEIEPHAERSIETVDLLVLPPQSKPVYFIVKGSRHEGGRTVGDKLRDAAARLRGKAPSGAITVVTPEEDRAHKQYFYDEHSCPTNWLNPVMVYHDGDSDPHGLIEFVATRDDATFPPDENHGPNARDEAFVAFIKSADLLNENAKAPAHGNTVEPPR